MDNIVLLVLPCVPWDENGNGINKIVYNLIRYSVRSKFRILVVENIKNVAGMPNELATNIESIEFIKSDVKKRGSKLLSLFKGGTYEEQLPCSVLEEIDSWVLEQLKIGGVSFVHYVSSKFINIKGTSLPKTKQLISLIDNKELYYKRKFENSGGIVKLYSLFQLRKIKRIYEMACEEKQYHFVSDLDSRLFKKRNKAVVHTIENGVDIPKFKYGAKLSNKVFFHGNFFYEPNLVAYSNLMEIAGKSNLKDIKFILFGKGSERLSNNGLNNVEILGEVDDVYGALEYAGIYLSPLTLGSGIKNKVLEAMAVGMTVLGTEVSLDGIGLSEKYYRKITMADIDLTVEAILRTINDDKFREVSSRKSRSYIINNFSWAEKVSLYEKVYTNE